MTEIAAIHAETHPYRCHPNKDGVFTVSVASSEGRITDKALQCPDWVGVFFVRHKTSGRSSLLRQIQNI